MPAYNYGGYIYFNKNMDKPKEHHNHFILDQKPYFYIKSLPNLMDDIFTSLSKLFFDEMI